MPVNAKLLRMRESSDRTVAVYEVNCRKCGATMERSYQAVRAAEKRGTGCVCSQCATYPRHRKLDPYLERIVARHAGNHEQATAIRAMLSMVGEDEPVRISSQEFWNEMRRRWMLRPGAKQKTVRNYMTRIRAAMGLPDGRRCAHDS